MEIKIIKDNISTGELRLMARETFGDFVKCVCDLEKEVLALGGELHSDGYEALIENGSCGEDIWGFNIFPDLPKEKRLEFTSLINIRPNLGNRSMEIQNKEIREKIIKVTDKIILWN